MTRARHLGIQTIMGRKCHHIDAANGRVAWQVWVDAEGAPVPRRLFVDYRTGSSHVLRYGADISDLRVVDEVEPDMFVFTPPRDLEKSDLQRVAAGQYSR